MGADERAGAPAKVGSPRLSSPRSMATLLTSVETPFGAESCAFSEVGAGGEVFSRESLADRESGMSEEGMKRRWKEAIGSARGGQEADVGWTLKADSLQAPRRNADAVGFENTARAFNDVQASGVVCTCNFTECTSIERRCR